MAIAQVVAGARILISDLNAYYSLLKGSVGEAITLIYNAAGSVIIQPSSDPAAATEAIQIKNNAGTVQSSLQFDGRFASHDGAVGTPGHTFEGDKDSGTYRISTDTVGMAAGGAEKMRWDTTGVSLDGGVSYLNQTNNHTFLYYPVGTAAGVAPGVITNVGTGTTVLGGTGHGVQLNTGATNPSSTSVRMHVTNTGALTETAFVSKIRRISFAIGLNSFANNNSYLYITSEDVDTVPTATPRHLGVKFLNGTHSFTTADGTTEQTTAITSFITAATVNYFVITYDGVTARCYIDGVLRATHSTNVPTGGAGTVVFRAFINNNASASNVSLNLMQVEALVANS